MTDDIVKRLRHSDFFSEKDTLEAADEIEKLRAELAEYIAQAERGHQTMVAEACELRKETHKLRAALKPFAEMIGEVTDLHEDHDSIEECNQLTARQIRAAKAALGESDD